MVRRTAQLAGECDGDDRLLWADEPLASLQRACGGDLPGLVAVPALLALVRRARAAGKAQRGTVRLRHGTGDTSVRVTALPQGAGCRVALLCRTPRPLPGEEDRARATGAAAATHLHAMKVPVARIIARATAMRSVPDGTMPEPYATYALDIVEAARHLRALLDDFGADEQRQGGCGTAVDLLAIARRAAAILGPEASARRIAIVVSDVDPAVRALGDAGGVRQILLNLIGNAVRYAPPGSTVRIADASLAGRAAVTVADEGPGLLPEERLRAFDKFERLGRGPDDGGSGLGLYISRRLARAMGGELSVESDPRRGSRFTLALPPE